MKFCPNCGAERVGDAPFCYECGVKFEETEAHTKKKKESKNKLKRDKQSVKKRRLKKTKPTTKSDASELLEMKPSVDDNYDGYYEDVLPVDTEEIRQPLDKELIKQIALLVSGVVVVIAICILIMCYL